MLNVQNQLHKSLQLPWNLGAIQISTDAKTSRNLKKINIQVFQQGFRSTNPTTPKSGSVGIVVFFSAAQNNYILYRGGLLGPKICNS